jgi:Zn finger protein HypA/HybF involved in hydrogenase expression
MHERRLAQDLVRSAGLAALEEGASRVSALRLRIGGASHIDPESLRGQVEWWAHGTIMEGAIVMVEQAGTDVADRHSEDVRLVSMDVER